MSTHSRIQKKSVVLALVFCVFGLKSLRWPKSKHISPRLHTVHSTRMQGVNIKHEAGPEFLCVVFVCVLSCCAPSRNPNSQTLAGCLVSISSTLLSIFEIPGYCSFGPLFLSTTHTLCGQNSRARAQKPNPLWYFFHHLAFDFPSYLVSLLHFRLRHLSPRDTSDSYKLVTLENEFLARSLLLQLSLARLIFGCRGLG